MHVEQIKDSGYFEAKALEFLENLMKCILVLLGIAEYGCCHNNEPYDKG